MNIYKLFTIIVVSVLVAILLASALNSFTRVANDALAEVAPTSTPRADGRGPLVVPTAKRDYLPIIFLNAPTDGFWSLYGNAGTTNGTHFLGTTDNVTFTIRVSNTIALRMIPTDEIPNLLAGYSGNSIGGSVNHGSTIGGGGSGVYGANTIMGGDTSYSTIAGGVNNIISVTIAYNSAIGGGSSNVITGTDARRATIGGGASNTASAAYATIGGGYHNTASASIGDSPTVGGGYLNTASNNNATVSGGVLNSAGGENATVGGGYSNIVTNTYGTIGGGGFNTVRGSVGTIAGGGYNVVNGQNASIGGGYQNTNSGSIATIGGGNGNVISPTGSYATIGGGNTNVANGNTATVGGGAFNIASGDSSVVGGGANNTASSYGAFVGGGGYDGSIAGGNSAQGKTATVGGGLANSANADYATIAGGVGATASGQYSMIPGGRNNLAQGDYSFAAGRRAKANDQGAFVWADSTAADINSSGTNQFIIRANGGIAFITATTDFTPNIAPNVFISTSTGAYLSRSGVWTDVSNKNVKANFAPLDSRDILARVATLPVSMWSYQADDPSIRHIGPTAQDFYATFNVGQDDTHLAALDTNGVALAAIQGLNQVVQDKDARITNYELRMKNFESRVAGLEAQVAGLTSPAQPAMVMNNLPLWGLLILVGVGVGRRWR